NAVENQLVAPSIGGQIFAPATVGTWSGTRMGRPSEPMPLAHVSFFTKGFAKSNFPEMRSSTYKNPLRLACNSNLRGCPFQSASTSTGGCTASQSQTSCGVYWKYHLSLPVLASRAMSQAVYRLSPRRSSPLKSGPALPVGQ